LQRSSRSSDVPGLVRFHRAAGRGSRAMSTAHTGAGVQKQTGITVMPHLTCEAAGQASLTQLLDYFRRNGIENILALRGDLTRQGTGRRRQR